MRHPLSVCLPSPSPVSALLVQRAGTRACRTLANSVARWKALQCSRRSQRNLLMIAPRVNSRQNAPLQLRRLLPVSQSIRAFPASSQAQTTFREHKSLPTWFLCGRCEGLCPFVFSAPPSIITPQSLRGEWMILSAPMFQE